MLFLRFIRLESAHDCGFMKSLFPEKYHRSIYIFSLIVLVIGLPLSKFLMSISQLIIMANWLLEGNFKQKIKTFWNNKAAVLFASVMVLHFIGLLYTSDFDYAFKDMRIKLPLLVLPLVVSTSKPLSQKLIDTILKLFVAATIAGTLVSMLILCGIIDRPLVDTRSISIFISHIRFSLLICVAICISVYYVFKETQVRNRLIMGALVIWMLAFLIIMESLTGLIALFVVGLVLTVYYIVKSDKAFIKYGGLAALAGVFVFTITYVRGVASENGNKEKLDLSKLERYTSQGNEYDSDVKSTLTENGHLIWINYQKKELKEAWEKRSKIGFHDNDLKGNLLEFTLVRYLASKGQKKDGAAVDALSDTEIKAIERGVTNVNYQNISSLRGRIYETLWEIDVYKTTGNANGHSLTQRFEYWRTALGIIASHPLIGVGTGDVAKAFEEEYVRNNSSLAQQWRLRAHNQYLTFAVTFGIIGLTWFLFTLVYPFFNKVNRVNFLYVTFFIVATVSFFTEDTLETQAGVTFYAFLNTFFLFAGEKKAPLEEEGPL